MRAGATEETGSAGQSVVQSEFEKAGWGVADNPYHDLGTDLWLMVRDERRFDLGILIGAQVKTSTNSSADSKYFKEPVKDAENGEVTGWKFRDSVDHFHYWLSHAVPHIVILHDLEGKSSYWAHISEESVSWSSKTATVYVPRSQVISVEKLGPLVDVVGRARAGAQWEWSAWTDERKASPREELRYALLTPRLIAPHPNSSPVKLTASQSVGMLVLGRLERFNLGEIETKLTKRDSPYTTPDQARVSPDWTWKLFAAIYDYISVGELKVFEPLLRCMMKRRNAKGNPERLALIAVVSAAALLEEAKPDEALSLLDDAIRLDVAYPVDNAWMLVQKARALREVGRMKEARDLALSVQNVRGVAPNDPTATAIFAAAAQIVFTASDWGEKDVSKVVSDSDTVSAWWRSQQVSTSLSKNLEQEFVNWSESSSRNLEVHSGAWLGLRSASLMAGLVGDHNGWRRPFSLIAKLQLLSVCADSPIDLVVNSLHTLRVSGDADSLDRAMLKIVEFGPAAAARKIASEIDLNQSTSTTARSDLAILIGAGDVMATADADRCAAWALKMLHDKEGYIGRIHPTFAVDVFVLKLLIAVGAAASPGAVRDIIDHLAELPAQEDQAAAHYYGVLIGSLPHESWEPDDRRRLALRNGDHWELADAYDKLLMNGDEVIRARVFDEANKGSWRALTAFDSASEVPEYIVKVQIRALSERVRKLIGDAHSFSYHMGGVDSGRMLTVLNMWHSSQADWTAILEMLADPHVHPRDKRATLFQISDNPKRVPAAVILRLEPILQDIEVRQLPDWLDLPEVRRLATEALVSLHPDSFSIDRQMLLMRGGSDERITLARILARLHRQSDLGVLMLLAYDVRPEVRAEAAWSIARWVISGTAHPEAREFLESLVATDPGTLLARRAVSGLGSLPAASHEGGVLLQLLRRHISSVVRRQVEIAVQDDNERQRP
ncbi:DUF4365 domain-containing protein [Nocardia fusca]|uniref:DUF4365 domain-containing protein n=1 Tax=Nocardia fusca TaxID=941183 RepID=A0ABV3F8D5_9NOCA